MLDIRFKECCYECAHRKTNLKEGTTYAGANRYSVSTQIGCEHEEVCKEYREPDKEVHGEKNNM